MSRCLVPFSLIRDSGRPGNPMNRAPGWQQLRQWLETDAAFDATEVPIAQAALQRITAGAPARVAAGAPVLSAVSVPTPGSMGTVRPGGSTVAMESRKPSFLRYPSGAGTNRSDGAGIPDSASISHGSQSAVTGRRDAIRVPATTVRVSTVAKLPPIPRGDIAALPEITAAEKTARLDELRRQAEAELGRYLTDIATKVVFGEGDPNAALMFVGEGPGAEEDRLGRPFVGRSGQLLDRMIQAMGLARYQVYIGNVVKLRAADPDSATGRLRDRPPTPAEAAVGIPWLHRQIEIIRPKVLVTLGASAIRYLIGETDNVTRIRGQWRHYRGIPVMPTYHPSFLLRTYTAENRGKVWSDLKQVMAKLHEGG